ncbi:MAG: M48 family metallopeptidase [Candidatus Micrarchaeota archaeon]|nr:M48 family metallopeptidase [Candidatus Micrarchaeota archaeon]
MVSFWDVQNKNKLYSYLLALVVFLILLSLFALFSFILGDNIIFILFFGLFTIIYPLITYFYSHKIVLRLTGAQPADPIKDIYLINVGEGLALAAGLKKPPKFYILEDPSPNAFATGPDPDNAVVVVTRGLLNIANRQELEGVIAHELSHIKNYDTRFMTVVVVMVGLIGFLASILSRSVLHSSLDSRNRRGGNIFILLLIFLAAVLTPIIANLVGLAISRKREYLADASAAQLTRNPEGLASALEKIKNAAKSQFDYGPARALFISDPQKEEKQSFFQKFSNLFSTHPPIDERIKILRSM